MPCDSAGTNDSLTHLASAVHCLAGRWTRRCPPSLPNMTRNWQNHTVIGTSIDTWKLNTNATNVSKIGVWMGTAEWSLTLAISICEISATDTTPAIRGPRVSERGGPTAPREKKFQPGHPDSVHCATDATKEVPDVTSPQHELPCARTMRPSTHTSP